jgi:hypothetical protein
VVDESWVSRGVGDVERVHTRKETPLPPYNSAQRAHTDTHQGSTSRNTVPLASFVSLSSHLQRITRIMHTCIPTSTLPHELTPPRTWQQAWSPPLPTGWPCVGSRGVEPRQWHACRRVHLVPVLWVGAHRWVRGSVTFGWRRAARRSSAERCHHPTPQPASSVLDRLGGEVRELHHHTRNPYLLHPHTSTHDHDPYIKDPRNASRPMISIHTYTPPSPSGTPPSLPQAPPSHDPPPLRPHLREDGAYTSSGS